MAKPTLSKAELDRRRREGRQPMDPKHKKLLVGGGAVLVVGMLAWVALGSSGTPSGFDENFAAFGLADDPFLGNPDSGIVVVGFEAPTCSACRGFHSGTLGDLKTNYFDAGKAAFYYSQFRIDSTNDLAIGMMQECAKRELGNDGFWAFTDILYTQLGEYPSIAQAAAKYRQYAATTEAEQQLNSCYDNKQTSTQVSKDWRVGDEWNVRATPTFYVFADGAAFSVPGHQIAQAIDELLAAQQA